MKPCWSRLRSWMGVLLIGVSLNVWSAPSRLEALPPGLANEATINGLAGVRYAINQTSGVALFLRDLE